ncbi:XXLT1 xylosyltransferase, partial [Polyodon spathula]|nr:XXLT1 xylosyltransferase [Polyodon spathula]
MGIPRLLSNAMGRVSTVRYYQTVLVIAAALAVVAFYSFGSDRQNFSSTTKRIKETHANHANSNDGDLSPDTKTEHRDSKAAAAASVRDAGTASTDSVNAAAWKRGTPEEERPRYFHAIMMFAKVDKSQSLQHKFQIAMRSMLKHARFEDGEVLTLHFVSDEPSREIGEKMLKDLLQGATFRCEVSFHNVKALTEKLFPIVEAMQKHFSAGSGTYYSDSIFFLSVAMHRIMPAVPRSRRAGLAIKHDCGHREGEGQLALLPTSSPRGLFQRSSGFLLRICQYRAGPFRCLLHGRGRGARCEAEADRITTEWGIGEIKRIVQLDLDLKYKTNIRELFEQFNHFPAGAVIGIAREMQPVYSRGTNSKPTLIRVSWNFAAILHPLSSNSSVILNCRCFSPRLNRTGAKPPVIKRHTFWAYRRENPDSKVGDPPPDGNPGFNSGVMLLDLEAMRRSEPYNQLLEPRSVGRLADKYRFQGHLGDQDFFTMISMEHPSLFHVLDCVWNRQLCTWWKDHGYGNVFQLYYHCQGPVKIYHGNCNTPIPDD